jgi:hypothetical protein
MVSKAEALKGAVEIPLTSNRSVTRPTSKGAKSFRGAFRAWVQAMQFGPDRSRESGRHLGARC